MLMCKLELIMSLHNRENYKIVGPIDLSLLPNNIVELFIESYDLDLNFKFDSHVIYSPTHSLNRFQVPKAFWSFMDELNTKWTREHIEIGIKTLNKDIKDVTPSHYPFAGKMLIDAINFLSMDKNSKILVAGSASPWIECICLRYGFNNITTCDYQIKKTEDSRISFIHASEISNNKFDLIISYSSIEHDGLGRYGDPINPYGPFNAVSEFYNSLNFEGKLLCGVPVYTQDVKAVTRICANLHIIFSQKSIDKLFRKFKILNTIYMPTLEKIASWQNQPVFILEKV